MTLMPYDEINTLGSTIRGKKTDGTPLEPSEIEDIEEEIFEMLVVCYLLGVDQANDDLGADYKADSDLMREAVYRRMDGMDFRERIAQYGNSVDTESMVRVLETEAHHAYNSGAIDAAKASGSTKKTWHTMEDEKVRDPHWPLGGVTVGIDEEFYTEGASAQYPGAFGVPELDINCRCYLTFSR